MSYLLCTMPSINKGSSLTVVGCLNKLDLAVGTFNLGTTKSQDMTTSQGATEI